MKKMSRIASLLLAVTFTLTMFAGCGNSGKDSAKEQTQVKNEASAVTENKGTTQAEGNTYPENGLPKDQEIKLSVAFSEAGYGRAYYDYAVDTFTKKFPNVKIETKYSPKIGAIIDTKAQAKNDKNMFDILMGYSPYAENGKLEPLEDLLDKKLYDKPDKTLREMAFKGYMDNLSLEADGHIYYMPHTMCIGGLFYDKKFFQDNGWNQDPKTWDEFNQLCEAIKAKGITPMTFSGMYNYIEYTLGWPKTFEIAEMNGNLDAYMTKFRQYGTPYYDCPETQEVFKRLYDWGKKGYFTSGLSALTHIQSQMMAINHKVAMVSCADWIENEMEKEEQKGSLDSAIPADFEWGYMAVPMSNDPNQTIWLYNSQGAYFSIWKGKPDLNKKWAKEFLVWMMNLDCQKAVAQWAGALPIRGDFMEDADNISKLRPVHRSILDYMKNHNVRLENAFVKSRPKFGPSQANADKLFVTNKPLIAEGKKDPAEILKKAEELLVKGIEEGKKLKK